MENNKPKIDANTIKLVRIYDLERASENLKKVDETYNLNKEISAIQNAIEFMNEEIAEETKKLEGEKSN